MTEQVVERILVVEDHAGLRGQLMRALVRRADLVIGAASVAEARAAVAEGAPQLVVLDVSLPDGDAFDVLAFLTTTTPAPVVVAISGAATRPEAFRLGEHGVRAFVEKPIELDLLHAAIDRALGTAPPVLDAAVRGSVGHASIDDVAGHVRTAMIQEALARANGSRRGAARLLGLSRQRLQHILRSLSSK